MDTRLRRVRPHDQRWFMVLKVCFFDKPKKVRLGDSGEIESIGSGDIPMIVEIEGQERQIVLKNVLLVPDIRRKLISIGAATSKS